MLNAILSDLQAICKPFFWAFLYEPLPRAAHITLQAWSLFRQQKAFRAAKAEQFLLLFSASIKKLCLLRRELRSHRVNKKHSGRIGSFSSSETNLPANLSELKHKIP